MTLKSSHHTSTGSSREYSPIPKKDSKLGLEPFENFICDLLNKKSKEKKSSHMNNLCAVHVNI